MSQHRSDLHILLHFYIYIFYRYLYWNRLDALKYFFSHWPNAFSMSEFLDIVVFFRMFWCSCRVIDFMFLGPRYPTAGSATDSWYHCHHFYYLHTIFKLWKIHHKHELLSHGWICWSKAKQNFWLLVTQHFIMRWNLDICGCPCVSKVWRMAVCQ